MPLLLTLLLFLSLSLQARENPFAPVPETQTGTQVEKTGKKQVAHSKPKVHPQRKAKGSEEPVTKKRPKIHPQRKTKVSEPVVTTQKPKIHPQRKVRDKVVINTSKARFVIRENSVYIETKDKMIRSFAIANPPSIVMDFRAKADFASKRENLAIKPFTKLEMGAHGDRYRVVLRLDKKHKYKIENARYGKILTILK